jgi:hypothetical protein
MGKDNAINNHQLALPLEPRPEADSALHHAWATSRLRMPYQVAIHVPAVAICLRNIAAAETRRKVRRVKRVRRNPEWQGWIRDEADSIETPLASH